MCETVASLSACEREKGVKTRGVRLCSWTPVGEEKSQDKKCETGASLSCCRCAFCGVGSKECGASAFTADRSGWWVWMFEAGATGHEPRQVLVVTVTSDEE